MASDDPAHRRNQSASNAIPLQNLSHNGTPERTGGLVGDELHRRTLSDRGRELFRAGRASASNRQTKATYLPVHERSTSPPARGAPRPAIAFVTTPSGERERIPDEDDEVDQSPVEDRGAFQAAIGFAGLSYNAGLSSSSDDDRDETEETPPRTTRSSRATLDSLPALRIDDDLQSIQLDDGPAFFSPGAADEDDTQPLTDSTRLRPSTLTALSSSPSGQRHDREGRSSRLSGLSVRFSAMASDRGRTRANSRLGDDLNHAEMGAYASGSDVGRSSSGRMRSLSPSSESPLHRTGTMLRQMSQRVVNLSNESEIVERNMRQRANSSVTDSAHLSAEEAAAAQMDGANSPRRSGSEKASSIRAEPTLFKELPVIDRNPLRGKSLNIFSPDSKLRLWLLEFLVHPLLEPFILLLIVVQTVVLALDSAPNVDTHPRPTHWGDGWSDWTLLGIFIIYTIEIGIKIIVSGFIFNPIEYSTIDRSIGVRQALQKKANELFALHRKPSKRNVRTPNVDASAPDSLLRSFTTQNLNEDVPGGSRQAQKKRLAYRAFLRHSFNRLDFVAIVSFWISFVLSIFGIEFHYQLYVFQMMSCLRILRLLGLTSGTSVILRSLKRAAPTLLNVAFLICFFWLLFSIVGVQSFKSSLRRTCTWDGANVDPPQANYSQNQIPPMGNLQFCGGWIAANGSEMPWISENGGWGTGKHKGYLCPQGSYCVEGLNPYNNTVSFDNILQSAQLVFVIMTSNTFTDIMYYLTDTDYLAAALFSAAGTIILTFWLISLLIAVITSSFQVIREESRSSAFMASEDPAEDYQNKETVDETTSATVRRKGMLQRTYEQTYWLWIVVIAVDLFVMCLRTATMSSSTKTLIEAVELIATLVLLFEIVYRFVADPRGFFYHRRNWMDLLLAIVTAVMQLPPLRGSGTPYAWLSVFQILRIYRIVLAVQLTRDLIVLVLRHVSGILNLVLFVFLLTFLAAIFAAQLFRGQLPTIDSSGNYLQVRFATIFNSFLGMYQILSSENWTTIMYNVMRYDYAYSTAWVGATFFILWYVLANFVVLNMFIAVIQENFDVSEDQKRMQQVRMFLQQKESGANTGGTLSLSSIFKIGRLRRQDPLDFGSAATEMLLKDAVVRDFLDDEAEIEGPRPVATGGDRNSTMLRTPSGLLARMKEWVTKHVFNREANPFYSRLQLSRRQEELDPRTLAREVVMAAEQRKVSQRQYLLRHPKYNVSLYIFKPGNPIRQACQRIVGPGRGERMDGLQPNPTIWYIFSAFIYLAIVGMVILACIMTPLFQLEYFRSHAAASGSHNWFVYTDLGFAALFTVEAVIKVIADGFFWSPNAYYRSSWGFIDGVVLLTLWVNVITSLYAPGAGSRAVGAFKALRALRLLNVSDSARDTFHSVVVLGGWKVLSAAFVSLSLLIPFAIYGLNLFAGKMDWCNDWQQYDVFNLTDCVGESQFSPNGWNIIGPRRVAPVNYEYDFDNFGNALFLLFQIVSQEGWIDVMWSAQSITGVFTQPSWFAQQGNALFFVVFNLLGAIFILTLFVSVFMRNYTEQTGVAFLTAEQRSWLELRKLLRQVAPSKRPNRQKKRQNWQEWCYRRAVTKTGRWQRTMTGILIAHVILLCMEWYPEPYAWEVLRNCIFFIFVLFYIANILIRIIGLSWTRFRRSAWDVYSVIAVSGTFVSSLVSLGDLANNYYSQLHKLLLVSLTLMLIPRNNQLDQLFKTAAASFSAIANLLATWFVLFLVYAIAFTQTFGLTRFGANETDNINFRTVPKALILLFRMSVGEGWNQIMVDFSRVQPPYCTVSDNYYDGDCGSKPWAYALFVSWNIISMYIFVNLFISLIYESFSYVYQRSSGLSVISREEIRRFKQAWAEHDPEGTGYISKEVFPRFLGELSGVFEMRIYDGDFTISALIEDCRIRSPRESGLLVEGGESAKIELDLAKLNRRLADMPVEQIRKRRARMNTFYEEVLVSANPDRGISFNALLMILAHYKVINDSKSLRLEEFLRRRARLQRVEEAVSRNIVRGFFDTLYWSRKRRRAMAAKESGRMTEVPTHAFGVPEIYVQDEGGADVSPARKLTVPAVSVTPVDNDASDVVETFGPASGSDAGSAAIMRRRSGSMARSGSASPPPPTRQASGLSPHHRPSPSTSSIQPDWHFAAAIEGDGGGGGGGSPGVSPPGSPNLLPQAEAMAARSRANSAVSQHEMMGMFQDSAWGQSMRRSFTQKRGAGDAGRPSS